MAVSPSSPSMAGVKPDPQPESQIPPLSTNPDPLLPTPSSSSSISATTPLFQQNPNPSSTPNPSPIHSSIQAVTPSPAASGSLPAVSPSPPVPPAPSFRPMTPQFSPIRPPGIFAMTGTPQFQANPMPFVQAPNGFMPMHVPVPGSSAPAMASAGIPRYPTPFVTMIRPGFPPRPPTAMGAMPPLSRPPMPGIRVVPPIMSPPVRPAVPIIPMMEKPQTTVYVGKIATTVENDFLLSLLRLCGPVKSWKRAQDPSNGAPKGFGFCEFESAEGVLRALRLLSKFNVDGQELVLNVNQATRDYLERYVEKKIEREKQTKEAGNGNAAKEEETAPGVEKNDEQKTLSEELNKETDESNDKANKQDTANFGIVTDEDREGDKDALEKLANMMEERSKTRPLPPPPIPAPGDPSGKSNSEVPTRSRDGDSDVDIVKSVASDADMAEDKNDDETTSENKTHDHERPETSSSDRGRRHDRGRERDREQDLKREKERELERYERERERERLRREREREQRIREAERIYKERVKEWESREREKEYQRLHEKEREKERERERRREIKDQEEESDEDDTRKRRHRSSVYEEKRKKRQRERDDDMADRLREEEEIAEAKRRALEEQDKTEEPVLVNGSENLQKPVEENNIKVRGNSAEPAEENSLGDENRTGDVAPRNGNVSFSGDEPIVDSSSASDTRQNSIAPTRKLGFGLMGSGKRTFVPSVFHEDDDEETHKEKKMRPLVPIDYSTEELEAGQASMTSGPSPNLAAAAEFAKKISNVTPKEERVDYEKDRTRRSSDRSGQRDRERNEDESKERSRDRENGLDKPKPIENQKLLDAKQLIDMIPKTKEELFSYDINWEVYDKHELHHRMRPWISKKITEFLGEEEATLVDFIVSSTRDHVKASQMLELLQAILDDEAEMFVLKMWRMLIFEIKKVETGLSMKTKA
ncbi:RNA-binding protein 25 isoform X1 [Amborella trichopoda]|uniref:RNA-binding protein 25 isoform X1 n=2 Tax=Amborella trichopoda TaxID=13333 RepID=UPI0009C09CEE|nr:RNA-binding protein 25 isoform X1 [Amborella trichopoda]|eukprot:XP_020522643.1 RNA-binding protein 25 isoform X1 [Amborella trichopoda]